MCDGQRAFLGIASPFHLVEMRVSLLTGLSLIVGLQLSILDCNPTTEEAETGGSLQGVVTGQSNESS